MENMNFDFIAIDFETANNDMSSACSIGLVAVKNNEIAETFYSLINPGDIQFENSAINGITPNDVKNAPSFPEVWAKIKLYFIDNIIVAHNAIFDMSILKNCLLKYEMDMPNFSYVCSIPFSTIACRGENVGRSLEARASHFDIEVEGHHNALSDAVTCAKLVLTCIKLKKRKSFNSYCSTFSSLPIKQFKDLTPQKELKKNKFNKISVSEIKATVDSVNETHPLYGKNIVFTGELKIMDRKAAMQKVVNLGAVLKSGVSKKTDYLVVGVQDKSLVGDDGMSSKEEKAYELIAKGCDIKILNEDEFLALLT